MKARVLFVDDEPNVLAGFERLFRKEFAIDTAPGGRDGLAKITAASEPYHVIISDMRMPEMKGDVFLTKARDLTPDTIRMVLTGETDITSAVRAVNDGAVFRFLLKPCSEPVLRAAIDAGVRQYQLETAERDLLEKTLSGSVKVLTEVLSLVNPAAFGRALRIRRCVRHIAGKLRLQDAWQFEIAAMLSQIGCVTLSPATLESVYTGQSLSDEEQQRFMMHPSVAHDLLTQVPRLEQVAQMIVRQNEPYSPADADDFVTVGARMLRVCLDFDRLIARGQSLEAALRTLTRKPGEYDPTLLAALEDIQFDSMTYRPEIMAVAHLEAGMVIDQDVRSDTGLLLVAKGHEATAPLVLRLRNLSQNGAIPSSVRVRVLRPGFELEQQRAAS